MVDNVPVNPATGSQRVNVAVEEVGGRVFPLYKLVGEALTPAHVDEHSGAVGVIEQEHLKIHAGKLFTLSKRLVLDDAGGTNPIHEFLGVVPADLFPHFRKLAVVTDGSGFDVDFYEAPTTTDDGTAVTSKNNKRNSTNEAGLLIYDAPTVTDDGELLESIMATGTKQSGALGSEGSNEWILKPDTKYLIRITNNTAGAASSRFVINMFWYE